MFAGRHPDEVAGIVLVDAAFEGFYVRAAREQPRAYLAQLEEQLAADDGDDSESAKREGLGYETSLVQARIADLPRGVPLTLLTAAAMELPEPLRKIWIAEQAAWAAGHDGVQQISVPGGHAIPRHSPDAVADAVRALLARIDGR